MDKPIDYKQELDEQLNILQIEVVKQLVSQVQEGENLRAAIDFLRLHRRSVPESAVLGSSKNPNDYLDGLIEDLKLDKETATRR